MNSKGLKNLFLVSAFILGISQVAICEETAAPAATDIAATTETTPAAAPAGDDAMMAKWKEYATPNENHQVLNQLAGNWDYSMKWWMKPDTTPEETTGTSENKWVMGGRFLEEKVSGTSMGQPFEGLSYIGYNTATKEYVSTWLDNMGTGIMVGKGSYDAAKKELTLAGECYCPLKGANINFRWVTRLVDENNFVFEGYAPDDSGKEFKSMEITYKKKA